MGLHVDKHLKFDKPLALNLMSTESCSIKVTNLADKTIFGDEKVIEKRLCEQVPKKYKVV